MPKSIRVLLADGFGVEQAAVAAMLAQARGVVVVGQCGGIREAAAQVPACKAQVVIFEPWPGDADALGAVQSLAAAAGDCGLLALSTSTSPILLARLLRRGVLGVVPKRGESDELMHAIGEVAAGRRFVSERVHSAGVLELLSLPAELDCDPLPTLTRRERQVFADAVDGFTIWQTGRRIGISPRTVEVHRGGAFRKLLINHRTHAIHYGLARGLGSANVQAASPAAKT